MEERAGTSSSSAMSVPSDFTQGQDQVAIDTRTMEMEERAGTSSSSAMSAPSDSTQDQVANDRMYLIDLWNKGMTNTKTDEAKRLMEKAVAKTKLKRHQIKNFIDNRRKQQMKAAQGMVAVTGKKRLYDIFMSQELRKFNEDGDTCNLSKEDKLRKAHQTWTNMKRDPATLENLKKSQDCQELPATSSLKMNKRHMRKFAKEVERKCKLMNTLGYECLFLAVHKSQDDYVQTGTEQALAVAHQKQFILTLSTAVTPDGPTTLESLSDEALRIRLQTHFNDRYMNSLGKRRVEYHSISKGRVMVSGMPQGIPFRQPASYGRATKVRLLKEAANITFSVVSEEDAHQAEVVTTEEENPDDALPAGGTTAAAAAAADDDDDDDDITDGVFIHHKESSDVLTEVTVDETVEDILLPMAKGQKQRTLKKKKEKQGESSDVLAEVTVDETVEDILLPMATGQKQRTLKKKKGKQGGKRKRKSQRKPETEGEYIVEKILEVRSAGGGLEFYIKWEGYNINEATWEPRHNLPSSLVEDFLSK